MVVRSLLVVVSSVAARLGVRMNVFLAKQKIMGAACSRSEVKSLKAAVHGAILNLPRKVFT